jgi:L-lactate utilization protein LutB
MKFNSVIEMGITTKYSAVNLLPELIIDPARWNRIPLEEDISSVTKAIETRGIKVLRVQDGPQALAKIKEIIPPGAEVMNGSSTTLIEIGYQQLMDNGEHEWKDLHKVVTSINDAKERKEVRRKSVTADYFLSGVNAIAMTGELVSCDATGSRVGAWPFAAKNLLLVSGVNKIVPTLQDALQRIKEYVYPLEDLRSKRANGIPSLIGKCIILAEERQPGRITLILINETFGY